jgi:PAS domain S-box-containing protein
MGEWAVIEKKSLERIADSVPALIALYSIKSGEYIYVNKALTRILGYEPEEFTSGGLEFVASLVHHEDLPRILAKNQKALDEANANPDTENEIIASFEYRMLHKDGRWRWVHTEGTIFERNAKGQVELVLNVSVDITDRKEAELRLKRSLQMLDNVLSAE